MIVSKATSSDAYKLAKLFVDNVDETYITTGELLYSRATLESGWNSDVYDKVYEEILQSVDEKDRLILVLREEESILGFTFTAILQNNCAEIWDFVVDLKHRGLGYGKKLYDSTLEECKKLGIQTVFLEVGNDNHRMIKFCESSRLKPSSKKYYTKIK